MKAASRVFIIINLVISVIVILLGRLFLDLEFGKLYLYVGFYFLITSIGSLIAVGSSSKGAIVVCGIFYIPVSLLASIFMFCIKKEDLRK